MIAPWPDTPCELELHRVEEVRYETGMADSVQRFYDDLADNYHLIYTDWRNEGVPREGEALDRLIRAEFGPPPHTVLDCSAGIGTQAIGLALQGYEVRATDVSPRAMDRAQKEARSFGVSIDCTVADVRSLEQAVEGTFDVVLSCDNSLPHLLGDGELSQAIQNMRSKVRPGGLLVIGIRDYDQILLTRPQATSPRMIDDAEGKRVVFQVWDWMDSTTYTLHLFIVREMGASWETHHYVTQYRALLRADLSALLRATEFSDIEWHLPSETGYHQPIVTARRRAAEKRPALVSSSTNAPFPMSLLTEQPAAVTYALLAMLLMILGTLAFIVQAAVDNVDARPAFPLACAIAGLASLSLSLRSAAAGDPGSSSAWAWFALPFPFLLDLLDLPFARFASTLGLSACDPTTADCSSPTFGFWLALLLFTLSAVLIAAILRTVKRLE